MYIIQRNKIGFIFIERLWAIVFQSKLC